MQWTSDSESDDECFATTPTKLVPRALTKVEITSIVDSLSFGGDPTPVQENLLEIHRDKTRKKLNTIKIYPSKIPELKKLIIKHFYSSVIAPGEAVGVNAAQCIGEPTTQGTLNTFHSAGISAKNTTLGFSRARELFNATKSPSTPTTVIYFTRDNEEPDQLHKIVDKFTQATINELLVDWEVYSPEDYEMVYWHDVWFTLNPEFGDLTEDDWCIRFKFDITKLYNHDLTVKDIAERLKKIYTDIRCIPSPLNLGIVDIIIDCTEVTFSGPNSQVLASISNQDEAREFYVKKIASPKLRGQQICGIPGITHTYRRKAKCNESFGTLPLKPEIASRIKEDEEWIVETDGTNLGEIMAQSGVDRERTMSNDMWEIANCLGIEAARNYLFIEFMNIVNSGGTTINPVHIQILVDKMTYTGSIRAIARFGVETAQYDPIARATFEEVMSQIITSAMFSERDHLNGISSNIVLGKAINAGTGRVRLEDIPIRVVRPAKKASRKTSKKPSKSTPTLTPGRAKIRPPTNVVKCTEIEAEDI